jgi:peptidoglycan/xylan/chitin deacetylase (PgdA/CDA1 family)
VLDHGQVTGLLRKLNRSVGLLPEEWYMSAEQLVALQDAGHSLGGHGFDHVALSTLSPEQQAVELHRAQAIMSRLFGSLPRTMAYPYGRSTEETETIARACGFTHCFSTLERVDAKFLRTVLGSSATAAA